MLPVRHAISPGYCVEPAGGVEIALYTGKPADEVALREHLERLSRSLLLRIASIRIRYEYLLGRLALVGPRPPHGERHARALARFDNPVARVWARVLRAGAALHARDRRRAEPHLVAGDEGAVAAGMKLTRAAVRFRLAELRRDDAMLATSSQQMTELGVRIPPKMVALLVPYGARQAELEPAR